MRTKRNNRYTSLLFGLLLSTFPALLHAQAEVQAWGNLTGLRAEGKMHRFETSLCVIENNWNREWHSGKERVWSRFQRDKAHSLTSIRMDSLHFSQTVLDDGPGATTVQLSTQVHQSPTLVGAFFHLRLPAKAFETAKITVKQPAAFTPQLPTPLLVPKDLLLHTYAHGLEFTTAERTFTIEADSALIILLRQDAETGDLKAYFTIKAGAAEKKEELYHQFRIHSRWEPQEQLAAEIQVFPAYPGNQFLGFGGNFRLQNDVDPQVIDYCLEELDIRMGRVEMPWDAWHPVDSIDPYQEAVAGRMDPHVEASMLMAQRLAKENMPVLLAIWFPPQWAAEGTVRRNPRHLDGSYGWSLREDKMPEIYRSIASYIQFLKATYEVEIAMFSFNESDLGINVRQTGEEHTKLIKGLGAYLTAMGLNTGFLLGDTADANGLDFVEDALSDPEAWPYIRALSFHSWRGCTDETLIEWYEAADRLNVPLLVGEGSIDAAAWRYPQIFTEPHYALEEIKLYIRMLDICQVQSILQWQLTADYSPLIGGGVFGNNEIPLQATRRFWNLKQLASTPANMHVLPTSCTAEEDLYMVALADSKQKRFVFHLVNTGGPQEIKLNGIPKRIRKLQVMVTDETRQMQTIKTIPVSEEGGIELEVDAACFLSLISM